MGKLPSAASQDPRAESLMPPVQPFEGISWSMLERRMHFAVTAVPDVDGTTPEDIKKVLVSPRGE